MTITLPLQPREEALLVAAAEAKGVSTDLLVREAVDKMLAEMAAPGDTPKTDARPIWELIADTIKDVPLAEFADLPQDGASEHNHYLYGHPKRGQ
jgi:hypothetical protein